MALSRVFEQLVNVLGHSELHSGTIPDKSSSFHGLAPEEACSCYAKRFE